MSPQVWIRGNQSKSEQRVGSSDQPDEGRDMGKYTVQGTDEAGHVPLDGPDLEGIVIDYDAILEEEELPSKEDVEAEIDRMLRLVRSFWKMEPDEVMRASSALSARCSELYVNLHRVEGKDRTYRQVRTQHVVPLLDELDRQFKTHSRMVEIRKQDLEMLRGSR